MSATAIRLTCYAALMVLLAATIGASFLPLGGLRLAAHISVALVQGFLIFVIFMRLRESPPLIRILAGGATLWLLILFALMFVDYSHR